MLYILHNFLYEKAKLKEILNFKKDSEGANAGRINATTEISPLIETIEHSSETKVQKEQGFKEIVADKVTLESFLEMQ